MQERIGMKVSGDEVSSTTHIKGLREENFFMESGVLLELESLEKEREGMSTNV